VEFWTRAPNIHYVQAVLTVSKVAVSGASGADNIGTQRLGLCASVEFHWQLVSRCGRARYWSGVSMMIRCLGANP
jgi:hypothetical protein